MPVTFRLPDVGEGLHEAEIVRWLVGAGDAVAEDQPLVEVQTDKATVELPAPAAGVIGELHAAAGDVVKVGAVLVTILAAGEQAAAAAPAMTAQPPRPSDPRGKGRWAPATPSTRRLGRELGVDVNALLGTGPGGRVTDDDVRRAAAGAQGHLAPAATSAPPPPAPGGLPPAEPEDQRIPLRGVRRVIAERMARAKATIPHAAAMEEADMSALAAVREELRAAHPDLRLSYLPFIVKAVAHTLPRFPALNASLDEAAGEIVLRGPVHVGIATATDDGLVVPVVRDVRRKSVLAVAAEIAGLAERARTRRLRPEELAGSTFTISNIGAVGGILSVPIINHPETGILGVHRVQERPVGRGGQVVLRPMTYLTLAFDHRVVDGDVAARFLTQLVRYLEQPSRLLAEMI